MNPYENEPGFEDANSDFDKKNQEAYVSKIRHETIRISIIQRLEDYLGMGRNIDRLALMGAGDADIDGLRDDVPFEPFRDKCKLRFLWYFDSYLQAIIDAGRKHKDNTKFEKMPFEGSGNIMDGVFNYTDLQVRLGRVKNALERETENWAVQGKIALQKEQSIATNVHRQYEQTKEAFKAKDAIMIDIEEVDKNPFVWDLTLYRPGDDEPRWRRVQDPDVHQPALPHGAASRQGRHASLPPPRRQRRPALLLHQELR